MTKSTNVVWHSGHVTREQREERLGQRGCVVWFTGLSGSGKSTIACEVERLLAAEGHLVYVLDGDNIRHGLNGDLGFGPEDRKENIRRVSEVASLLADSGLIVLTAFISPYRANRAQARTIITQHLSPALSHQPSTSPRASRGNNHQLPSPSKLQVSGFPNLHPFPERFLEAFVDVPLEICEQRDPKQLYAKARAGEISDFTGISSPYEAPESPEIALSNHTLSAEESAAKVVAALKEANILTGSADPN